MRRLGGVSALAVLAIGLTACGRLGLGDPLAGSQPQPQATYEPLPASPTAPVTSSALPPPAVSTQPLAPAPGAQPVPGQAPPGTAPTVATPAPTTAPQVAVNDKAPPIGRGEFVGAWRIASGADNCQLFASLTSWAGGMRASTKGCNSAELQRVSAWELSGKQVSLKAGDGAVLATLTGAGPERFSGSTTAKQAITLSR